MSNIKRIKLERHNDSIVRSQNVCANCREELGLLQSQMVDLYRHLDDVFNDEYKVEQIHHELELCKEQIRIFTDRFLFHKKNIKTEQRKAQKYVEFC